MSNTMTHKRLTNAFLKAGYVVTQRESWDGKPRSNDWMATNPVNKQHVEWTTQDGFVPAKDGKEAHWDKDNQITTYVVKASPHTDIQTDYFCDSFYHTIKAAVKALT